MTHAFNNPYLQQEMSPNVRSNSILKHDHIPLHHQINRNI